MIEAGKNERPRFCEGATPTTPQRVCLPAQFTVHEKTDIGHIRQLRRQAYFGEASVDTAADLKVPAWWVKTGDLPPLLVIGRRTSSPMEAEDILLAPQGEVPRTPSDLHAHRCSWLRPRVKALDDETIAEGEARCAAVLASWRSQFRFVEEHQDGDHLVPGLRPPQVGAVYAVLAHWKVTSDLATVVMPTGTGKTETMLALLVNQRPKRLLVVVPTDALRDQIAAKFLTLGVLKSFGVIGQNAQYPVVGTLRKIPRTTTQVDEFLSRCNVIVTTMAIAGQCMGLIQRRIAEHCSHLFIDEAHHSPARTWSQFRQLFDGKPTLQFTATPFRGDGKLVDGKVIFNYPLKKAQEDQYFKPINYKPVLEFSLKDSDMAIARKAIRQLEEDLNRGFDHLVMVRVATIARAHEVHALYAQLVPEHNPLIVHSGLKAAEQRGAINCLRDRRTRIIVCVDMLGEGFDLPELKIAALHDMHKSLAITLQFTGRFTRTRPDLGDATVIANGADVRVEEALRQLYAEDSDWNTVLRMLSAEATGEQVRRLEFLDAFENPPSNLPLQNIFPKMSTVVYRTGTKAWRPERLTDVISREIIYGEPVINHKEKVLLFITREREPIAWGNIKEIQNTVWDLYLIHWSEDQRLLFIHSSNKDSVFEGLAKAIGGDGVDLIRGETVFRALSGIKRLILMNLGLGHSLSRAVRFTMHVGSDIHDGLAEAHTQGKYKANTFGYGFEEGNRVTVGCSRKGRVWSYRIARDISQWVEWCHHIGRKLVDDTLGENDFLKNVIRPQRIVGRPEIVPVTVEWSDDFLARSEESMYLEIEGQTIPFFEAALELTNYEALGPLRFQIRSGAKSAEYEVQFRENGVDYIPCGRSSAHMIVSRRRKSISEWFQEEPPVFRFEDGAFLIYNELFTLPAADREAFDRTRIEVWNWTGVDLRKESQTPAKLQDSIQYHVLQQLLRPDHDPYYDVIVDDDDSYEAADIVAMKVTGDRLLVHLYHLKFSKESTPGARSKDLYEVCGQAQRSLHWKLHVEGLINHLLLRDKSRKDRTGVSRFERGDARKLLEIKHHLRHLTPEFRVTIVQPGLSRQQAEQSQLELLAVTEFYLKETLKIDFGVIASP